MKLAAIAFAGWTFLAAPPVARFLEADLVGHMVVQLPALAATGTLLGYALQSRAPQWLAQWNGGGVPGLLLAIAASLVWMLPRSLDLALADPRVELAKLITVPLLIGLPLGLSWPHVDPRLKGLVQVKLLAMLGVLAWLYHAAPVRICNSYLLSDQARLSQALLLVMAGLGALWALRWLRGPRLVRVPA